jgi:hypothetical protein
MNEKSYDISDASWGPGAIRSKTFKGPPGHRSLHRVGSGAQELRNGGGDRNLGGSRSALAASARAAARALRLRGAERIVLEKLASCYGGPTSGRALVWPSNAYLVAETGFDERTIRRAITSLITLELVIPKDNARRNRCPRYNAQGKIIDAFGFDLGPVCSRYAEFIATLAHREAAARAVAGAAREVQANCLAIRSALEAAAAYDPSSQIEVLFSELDELSAACSRRSSFDEAQALIGRLLDLRGRVEALFLALTSDDAHSRRAKAESQGFASHNRVSCKPSETPSRRFHSAHESSRSSLAEPGSVSHSPSSSRLRALMSGPGSTKTSSASRSPTLDVTDLLGHARPAAPNQVAPDHSLGSSTKSHSSAQREAEKSPRVQRENYPNHLGHQEMHKCPGNRGISSAYNKMDNYDSTEGLSPPVSSWRRAVSADAADAYGRKRVYDRENRDEQGCGVRWSAPAILPLLLREACPDVASFRAPLRTSGDIIAAGQALRPCFGASRDAWIEGAGTIGELETAQLSIYVHQLACDQLARTGPPSRDTRGMFGGLFRKFIRMSAAGQFNLATALMAMRRKRAV